MRILTLANQLGPAGGLERTQLTNCQGLVARGHQLDLVYVEGGEFAPAWRAITSTMMQVSTTLPRRAHPFSSSLAAASGIRRARHLEPEVVYAYRYWDLPFAVAVAARARTSVIYHLCLPPPEPLPRLLRTVLARVNATISVSQDTLRLWSDTGLRSNHTTIVPTSVELDRYFPAGAAERTETRRTLGLTPEDFVILFAGRISPEKGVEVLIKAFGMLVGNIGHGHLVILGSPTLGTESREGGVYADKLHQMAEGLPVSWLPRRSDVVPLLQAADVAVVPSLWAEPLSRSIIEALACGVPVIASRVGGSPEILTGWLSDFLVEPDDADALAGRLASLHDWPTNDPGLGERCRRFAEDRLSPTDEIDLIEEMMLGEVQQERAKRG